MSHTQVVSWIQLFWAFPNCTGRLSCGVKGAKVRPKGFMGNGGCFGCLQPAAVPRRAQPRDTWVRIWLRWGRWPRTETGDDAQSDTGVSHHCGVDATYPILHYLKQISGATPQTRPSIWVFLQHKNLMWEKKQGKTSQSSLKIRPRSASQPKPSIFGRTPQVYSNLYGYSEGHRLPNQRCRGALFLGYMSQAAENSTPKTPTPGHGIHLLRWEEMFLWHHILLAHCSRN